MVTDLLRTLILLWALALFLWLGTVAVCDLVLHRSPVREAERLVADTDGRRA